MSAQEKKSDKDKEAVVLVDDTLHARTAAGLPPPALHKEKSRQDVVKNSTATTTKDFRADSISMTIINKEARSLFSTPIPQIKSLEKPAVSQPQLIEKGTSPPPAPSSAPASTSVDDDIESITHDLRRTPLAERKESFWDSQQNQIECQTSSSLVAEKKEITWNDYGYLDRVHLKDLGTVSRVWTLERKASVGPCKSRTCFSAPSGVMFCVPKKSTKIVGESCTDVTKGINISFSGKSMSRIKCKSEFVIKKSEMELTNKEQRAVKVDINIPHMKLISAVRNKLDLLRNKIQNILE